MVAPASNLALQEDVPPSYAEHMSFDTFPHLNSLPDVITFLSHEHGRNSERWARQTERNDKLDERLDALKNGVDVLGLIVGKQGMRLAMIVGGITLLGVLVPVVFF